VKCIRCTSYSVTSWYTEKGESRKERGDRINVRIFLIFFFRGHKNMNHEIRIGERRKEEV